ncbi:hypothetical protein BGZ63DRAFT_376802 [Mariannaea sp. PMI_226]|nr:hypothetical protein BGZ63DRAFT_376802 [Mariannaea sp. PMI_226]
MTNSKEKKRKEKYKKHYTYSLLVVWGSLFDYVLDFYSYGMYFCLSATQAEKPGDWKHPFVHVNAVYILIIIKLLHSIISYRSFPKYAPVPGVVLLLIIRFPAMSCIILGLGLFPTPCD